MFRCYVLFSVEKVRVFDAVMTRLRAYNRVLSQPWNRTLKTKWGIRSESLGLRFPGMARELSPTTLFETKNRKNEHARLKSRKHDWNESNLHVLHFTKFQLCKLNIASFRVFHCAFFAIRFDFTTVRVMCHQSSFRSISPSCFIIHSRQAVQS